MTSVAGTAEPMASQVMRAFETEAAAFAAVVDTLSEDDLARPTNCPPWDVKDLVVHVATTLRPGMPAAGGTPTLREAADYYRRPDRKTAEYNEENVARAQTAAAEVTGGPAVRRLLADHCRAAIDSWSSGPLDRVVTMPAGTIRMSDYVLTRIVSVAVHGLDLALSLGRTGWTSEAALGVTRPVLVYLLGAEPPAALGWDPIAFLTVGTGRRPVSEAERAVLGARADAFPLLA